MTARALTSASRTAHSYSILLSQDPVLEKPVWEYCVCQEVPVVWIAVVWIYFIEEHSENALAPRPVDRLIVAGRRELANSQVCLEARRYDDDMPTELYKQKLSPHSGNEPFT